MSGEAQVGGVTIDGDAQEMPAPDSAVTETPIPVAEATGDQQPVVYQPKALGQRNPVRIAEHFWRSGFFPDVKSLSQAVVKIIAGEEIGIGRMAAVQGITIIEGKLGYTGNLVATLIKRHPTYEYKVLERTNGKCLLEFYDGEDLLGESEFTLKDAERAELVKPKSNWVKWPRAMCFNRALTEGTRAYIPDVTAGSPAYTDDEIEEVVLPPEQVAEVEAANGATTGTGLTDGEVEGLHAAIKARSQELGKQGLEDNWLDGLNVLLGSIGLDAIGAGTDFRKGLVSFSPQQRQAIEEELEKVGLNAEIAAEEGAEDAAA